ncbi:MAG: hypothetical protein EOP91_09360 [Lysobacteraceae bacterium]|nr:MAG: hypothetical protein EOP91_09360 [Xanthomonadaceae bacterium]
MEIKQSRHSNRIRYVFGEDEVQYSLQDGSGSRSFSVQYTEISRDRQVLEERNQWLRNVGLLWLLLGGGMTVGSLLGEGPAKLSFWVWLGAFCYAVYRLRWTKFTLLPTEKGNLLVIDDAEGPRVIQELESRRAAQFLREYDFIDESETPEQQRKRFKWLRSEGALSEPEFQERLAMIETAATPIAAVNAPGPSQLLN